MNFSNKTAVKALISERHWRDGLSIRAIERELGIATSVLNAWCKRHGIVVRSKAEQITACNANGAINRPRGESHWAWGLRKETSPAYAAHSARMTSANPGADPATLARRNLAWSDTMRAKPTEPESIMASWLPGCGVAWIAQFPVGRYVIDFAFPAALVGLEIDGKTHEPADRKKRDIIRDGLLISIGWKIIRVRQDNVTNPGKILSVLKEHVSGFQIPCGSPPIGRKYRMLIRDAENPTGRKV